MSLLPLATSQSLSQKATPATTPLYFDDERGFEKATPPSDDVLNALLATAEVKENLEEIEDQSSESLRNYFKGVSVDAGAPRDKVFVFTSTRLPIGSGDSDWFWIVSTSNKKTRVVLFYIGHTVKFERRRTDGYKDVRAKTGTPNQPEVDLFRYDGAKYRLFSRRLRK